MKKKSKLLVLLVGMLTIASFSGPRVWAQDTPKKIEITAKRFAFSPAEITVKKGQPVVLVLNSADVAHGLRFRELNVDVKVRAGGTAEVQFTPQTTGDFVGHCSVFCGKGHGSMMMTMHVVE
ncbi:MAG TPA: cupredoxin domain-containing protein [Terracidiphilus sp.]|jgi:cytochrome c oxidase subunit 2|nr:cupredoxin domain-containing protein [Terracidiphilus sp.]